MPSKRVTPKTQKAAIGWLADLQKSNPTKSNAGQEVIERVQKCLARANHENANENESRAAVRMASIIMEQHNISLADVMEKEEKSAREKFGGISTVAIWPPNLTEKEKERRKETGKACNQAWVKYLVGAMQTFFDCRAYSTGLDTEIEYTFYGIAEHTVSAAIAFEAVHNQIQDWATKYKGVSTRNSYSLGVADGLMTLADNEKKAMEKNAAEYEAKQKEREIKALEARIKEEDMKLQRELDRLRNPPPREPTPELENDHDMDVDDGSYDPSLDYDPNLDTNANGNQQSPSDNEVQLDFSKDRDGPAATVDTAADFDAELQKFGSTSTSIKPTRPARADFMEDDGVVPSTEEAEDQVPELEETVQWKSERQLTTFREMSRDVEESVLKASKVKLKKGRKVKRSVKDKEAFWKGVEDSKKVEVRAARIEEGKDEADDVSTEGAAKESEGAQMAVDGDQPEKGNYKKAAVEDESDGDEMDIDG